VQTCALPIFGPAALEFVLRKLTDRIEQRRLQAREREIEPGNARNGEVVRGWIALAGDPVDRGSAGVAEAEQPCAFVERLAGGVVERRSQHPKGARLGDVDQQRVTAAREQAEERRLDRL